MIALAWKREERIWKDEEFFETLEEVFDGATVLAAYELIRRGHIDHFHGAVASGKESRIYWAVGPTGEDLAVKIYLTSASEFRRGIRKYLDDEMLALSRGSFRRLIYQWCRREYSHLRRAYNAGVRVPRPVTFYQNILVMEFIGYKGRPAPLIKDLPPEEPEKAYNTLLEYVKLLYNRAGIVHSDLSEYNVLNYDEEYVIIDLGQSVKSDHPSALEYLLRDITRVTEFFEKLGADVQDPHDVFKKIISPRGP